MQFRDLKEILKEFGISEEDKKLLRDTYSGLDKAIVEESLRDFCKKGHAVKKDKLRLYFKELFSSDIDSEYIQNRFNIGIAHERSGISPKSYIAQFSRWLDFILKHIKDHISYEKSFQLLSSLFKNILLDIAICIEAYQSKHKDGEVKSKKEIEFLKKLYHTLSAINMLVTTVEDKASLFREMVNILKEKGGFSYVAIFEKGKKTPLFENGDKKGLPTVCIPFKSKREEYVFEVSVSKDITVTEKEKALLEEIAYDISFALSKIEKHEKLSHLAYYDNITYLPNRIYFSQRLKELISSARAKSNVSVIVIAIDKFAELEQNFGSYWRSEIIKIVASRIKNRVRERDLLARIDQDKFSIAIESNNPEPVIENIIGRIRALFEEPIYFNKDEVVITLSFGIARFPYNAQDAEELISKAILSAEKAKELGGDTIVYYSEKISRDLKEKISIRTDLRKAFKNKEFVLYYQPKIELSTGKLKGAEALIRWVKGGKVIPPYKFIPVLEESEMIHDVGKWVIEEACRQIKEWKKKGIEIDVAVNVSSVQLRDFSSINEIISAIGSSNVHNLEVEITESAIMENISRSITFIEELLKMGIKTYIDDFGTGYSSLAYLKKLPVYGIKIDREFVKDIPGHKHDIEIIKAIIALAKVYNIKTVAEGPETEDQVRMLKELGCDFAQGYYFSKPLPADEFEEYFKKFSKPSSTDKKGVGFFML